MGSISGFIGEHSSGDYDKMAKQEVVSQVISSTAPIEENDPFPELITKFRDALNEKCWEELGALNEAYGGPFVFVHSDVLANNVAKAGQESESVSLLKAEIEELKNEDVEKVKTIKRLELQEKKLRADHSKELEKVKVEAEVGMACVEKQLLEEQIKVEDLHTIIMDWEAACKNITAKYEALKHQRDFQLGWKKAKDSELRKQKKNVTVLSQENKMLKDKIKNLTTGLENESKLVSSSTTSIQGQHGKEALTPMLPDKQIKIEVMAVAEVPKNSTDLLQLKSSPEESKCHQDSVEKKIHGSLVPPKKRKWIKQEEELDCSIPKETEDSKPPHLTGKMKPALKSSPESPACFTGTSGSDDAEPSAVKDRLRPRRSQRNNPSVA